MSIHVYAPVTEQSATNIEVIADQCINQSINQDNLTKVTWMIIFKSIDTIKNQALLETLSIEKYNIFLIIQDRVFKILNDNLSITTDNIQYNPI